MLLLLSVSLTAIVSLGEVLHCVAAVRPRPVIPREPPPGAELPPPTMWTHSCEGREAHKHGDLMMMDGVGLARRELGRLSPRSPWLWLMPVGCVLPLCTHPHQPRGVTLYPPPATAPGSVCLWSGDSDPGAQGHPTLPLVCCPYSCNNYTPRPLLPSPIRTSVQVAHRATPHLQGYASPSQQQVAGTCLWRCHRGGT